MLKIKFITAQRVVTTATTPEQLKETPETQHNQFISLAIRAHTGNAGFIYVSMNSQLASAAFGYVLSPGEVMVLDVSKFFDGYIDISQIWIDSANDGDGLSYYGFEVLQ